MTRLLPATVLTAAVLLLPASTAVDTRSTRQSQPGIAAFVRAHTPGTDDSARFTLGDRTI